MKHDAETTYRALLASFRTDPSISAAAESAHTSWRTARAAFYEGFSGHDPIRDTLAKEHELRRALAAEATQGVKAEAAALAADVTAAAQTAAADIKRQAEQLRGLVRVSTEEAQAATSRVASAAALDGAESHAEEVALVRGCRRSLTGLVVVANRLEAADAYNRLADIIIAGLNDGTVTAKTACYLAASLAKAEKDKAEAAKLLVQTERVLLGEPGAFVRHEHEISVDYDDPRGLDELLAKHETLLEQLRDHRERMAGRTEEAVLELPRPEPTPDDEDGADLADLGVLPS